MERKVMISIYGKQISPNDEPDIIELITEGTLSVDNGIYRLKYVDSELTGSSGTDTVFELSGDTVTLIRHGEVESQLVFQQGKKHYSIYSTPFGDLTMGIFTSLAEYEIFGEYGSIAIDYDIEIEHAMTGSSSFRIKIIPAEE